MIKSYLVVRNSEISFWREEAYDIAEGTPIIEGTFRQTSDTWTGIFESIDGQVYEIHDGYIKKEVA